MSISYLMGLVVIVAVASWAWKSSRANSEESSGYGAEEYNGDYLGPKSSWKPSFLENLLGKLNGRSERAIRREIMDLFGPMDDGEAILERTMMALRRLHPDKSERWRLEKALDDLKRDRRF